MAQRKPTGSSTPKKQPHVSATMPTFQIAGKLGYPHRLLPLLADKKDVFASAEKLLKTLIGPTESKHLLENARAQANLAKFSGATGQHLAVTQQGNLWLFVGLGKGSPLLRSKYSSALGNGVREVKSLGASELSVIIPEGLPWDTQSATRYTAEAVAMAAYSFGPYRTRGNHKGIGKIEICPAPPNGKKDPDTKAAKAGLKAAEEVVAGVALARDLTNHPASVAHTRYMVDQAKSLAKTLGAKCTVIQGDDLAKNGYGAIHAVGRSGPYPPALVALESGRPKANQPTLVVVGKGVVFDSGGLDLKPSSAMALMKKDMAGAGITLGVFRALVGLGLPLHVVAVVALAENMVGPEAFHPGDVLTAKSGLTIEITNTDAEGRLVLADAFALAKTYKPTYMVDFATLTGAARTALGKEIMALFSDHKELRTLLEESGTATGEAVWPLPLWEGYKKKLESPIADLVNAAADGMAGAITAALFLKEFAGDTAWAHIDCYGWSDGELPLFPKGGSGAGVRLMVELAEQLAGKKGRSQSK